MRVLKPQTRIEKALVSSGCVLQQTMRDIPVRYKSPEEFNKTILGAYYRVVNSDGSFLTGWVFGRGCIETNVDVFAALKTILPERREFFKNDSITI